VGLVAYTIVANGDVAAAQKRFCGNVVAILRRYDGGVTMSYQCRIKVARGLFLQQKQFARQGICKHFLNFLDVCALCAYFFEPKMVQNKPKTRSFLGILRHFFKSALKN